MRVAGVQVGRVTSVDFDSETNQALVMARVHQKVHLYSNFRYTIGIGGLVGERFVEIIPTDFNRGSLLFDGSSVDGTATPDMNDLFASADALMNKLNSTADSLNDIIANPANRQNLHASLANLNKATASAQFTAGLNQLLQRDSPSIDTLVANLKTVSADARTVAESLTPQLANTNIIHNLEDASAKARDIADRFEGITTSSTKSWIIRSSPMIC